AEVRRLARALLATGVRRGEHLAVWTTNWPQWVVTQFAAAHAGAVLVNINPAYRAHELEYVLNQADVTTLFLTDRVKSSDYFDLLDQVRPACPKLTTVVSIKPDRRPYMLDWDQFLGRADAVPEADLDARTAEVRAEDVGNIQYTSGTTG